MTRLGYVGAALLFLATPALADDDKSYHLFTQSEGGTVSLVHGLTKETCEFALNRIWGRPATEEEKAQAERKAEKDRQAQREEDDVWNRMHPECADLHVLEKGTCARPLQMMGWGSTHIVKPGDIKHAECFK